MHPAPRWLVATSRLLALLAVVLPVAVRAATTWTHAESAHFEVYTTAGESRAREALVYFERAHAFFSSYLKLSPKQVRPTRLVVFSNDKEYAPYRANESATAYYQPGPDRDYIVMRSLDADALPIVVHEYVHLIIRYSGEKFPVWLNEGLAEYFSTLAPEGNNKMGVGLVQEGRLRYLTEGDGRLMTLDKLFAVTHDSPEYTTKTHAGSFYSQCWALTHMLLNDERYRPQSTQFLSAVSNGTAVADALSAAYQRSVDVVFKDLQSYLRQDRYRYLLVDYTAPPIDQKPPTRVAGAFEAGLVTANLLAAGRTRESEARAAFEALAKERPDDLALVESRGYFELRRGHPADALPYFARAHALGTTNAPLLRDYAILVGPSDAEKTQALLVKALELAPEDLEARLRLASIRLSKRDAEGALAALAPVTHVPPESAVPFLQLVANASAIAGRWDEAQRAAARAVEVARTDSDKKSSTELAASIDAFVARRAAVARAAGPPAGDAASGRGAPKVQVTARITNFICNPPMVLEVTTASGRLRLLVEDLRTVRMEASGGVGSDIVCGVQDKPVLVGYDPGTNATLRTTGIVRLLDFRK